MPTRRTRNGRDFVLARVAAYLAAGGDPRRDSFLESEKGRSPRVYTHDIDSHGKWKAVKAAALGVSRDEPAIEVDVSGLDFDDDVTTPGGNAEDRHLRLEPAAQAEAPRQPEPRELVELQRTKAKAAELERRLKEALAALSEADERAGVVAQLRGAAEPPPILRRETASGLREATPVVLCSDWHVEETVDPRTVDGRNAYSPDEARRRVQRLTDSILWMLETHRSRFQIRDLVLWLGGDLIAGWIHEELQETNALTPIEAALLAQELIASLIRRLLAETTLERIMCPASYGNHGRTTHKRRSKNGAQTSYEWMIYHQLAQLFADEPRVEFQIANGPHLYLRVYDWTLRFHHGDDVNYWGGVGGLTIPMRKALAAWASFRPADLTCTGHFHAYHDLRDFVINGSLIGYSSYALSVKAQYEPAQQAFFLIDSKRFKCMSTPLWVTEEP